MLRTPARTSPTGRSFAAPWPATGAKKTAGRRDKVTYYRYKADSARRSLHGIDTQIAKAERAVAGKEAIKRNRFVKLAGGDRSVNRDLEAKARSVAGLKAYITNMVDPTPEFVIGAYHQLWHVEKSFRMSKHDLQARPIYHRKRESIDAHLIDRLRRPGRDPADRGTHRLVDQEVRPHHPPLPHRPDPRRRPDHSPPTTRYPATYATHSRSSTDRRAH